MKKLFQLLAGATVLVLVALVVKKLLEGPSEPAASPTEHPARGQEAPISAEAELDESQLGGAVSPELLATLVCPLDRGPLKLSSDGKWLVNPRNGYRYPIRNGVPVMLIEVGRKYADPSLVEA